MLISCIPPRKQTIQVLLAQPSTVFPVKYATNDQTTPMKHKNVINIPKVMIILSGFMLRLVIPSMARFIIFPNG